MRSLVGGTATIAALLLASCASTPPAPGPGVELITYKTSPGGPICEPCETLAFTAASDGRVWVERGYSLPGEHREWRTVRHRRQVTPEQFARFREALAAYRPVGERRMTDAPPCKTFTYDLAQVTLTWRGGGPDGLLQYDFGCDLEAPEDVPMALMIAPTLLGLEHPDGPSAPRAPRGGPSR
ncbi:hypothetical protein [Caulobacter sp. 17J65-9]|uniref:hypothetical protein n=1 Tax=Caulobacter sp. 17J65-9 TaxID=2709382 RepID=UPI0013CD4ED5|nr:hypothetical protein [Caulobacter sp. 17J65-9]NEX94893.1 hypothetical protein [Caulobacter sp. 17J65-9]